MVDIVQGQEKKKKKDIDKMNDEKGFRKKDRARLVYVFKQQFLVFKQHFTHSNALFHPHVFPQIFLNNNFQFLNTHTKQAHRDL